MLGLVFAEHVVLVCPAHVVGPSSLSSASFSLCSTTCAHFFGLNFLRAKSRIESQLMIIQKKTIRRPKASRSPNPLKKPTIISKNLFIFKSFKLLENKRTKKSSFVAGFYVSFFYLRDFLLTKT